MAVDDSATRRTVLDGATRRAVLRGSLAAFALGGVSGSAGCTASSSKSRTGPPVGSTAAEAYRVTRFVHDVVITASLSPLDAARVFSGVLLAVEHAAALVAGREPLLGHVRPDDRAVPVPVPDDLDEGGLLSAVATAAVPLLVPALGPWAWQLVADRRAVDLARRREAGVPPARLDAATALGQAVAVDVARWASGDGTDAATSRPYTAPTGPGLWRPTPPTYAAPAAPNCDLLRPIVAAASRDLPEIPPLPFSTAPGSPFRLDGEEVFETSRALSDEDVQVAEHWSDDRGQTGTPAGHWMLLAAEGCEQRGVDEATALGVLTATAVAIRDALRECFVVKYRDNVIRPVSYLNDAVDPAWKPLLITPPFPEHPSGHSVVSSAAAMVLTDRLGVAPLVDRVRAPRVAYQGPRSFESFAAAAEEASISRLLGGIHYRHALETGAELGTAIGTKVVAALLPRPARRGAAVGGPAKMVW